MADGIPLSREKMLVVMVMSFCEKHIFLFLMKGRIRFTQISSRKRKHQEKILQRTKLPKQSIQGKRKRKEQTRKQKMQDSQTEPYGWK